MCILEATIRRLGHRSLVVHTPRQSLNRLIPAYWERILSAPSLKGDDVGILGIEPTCVSYRCDRARYTYVEDRNDRPYFCNLATSCPFANVVCHSPQTVFGLDNTGTIAVAGHLVRRQLPTLYLSSPRPRQKSVQSHVPTNIPKSSLTSRRLYSKTSFFRDTSSLKNASCSVSTPEMEIPSLRATAAFCLSR